MKELQTIIREVKKLLPEFTDVYNSNSGGFEIYTTFTGFLNSNEYYNLYFRKHGDNITFEISHNTENKQYFIDMIKSVEPLAKISSYNKIVTYEKTIN